MATESMKMARNSFRAWKRSHPDAPLKKTLKRMTQASVEGFEMEMGIHTLPSIIVPIPEESVRYLQKKIKKLRGK